MEIHPKSNKTIYNFIVHWYLNQISRWILFKFVNYNATECFAMSESNYNWVCFECRFATRQAKTHKEKPKCHSCGKDCVCLGYKIRIPKKRDSKGWKKLQALVKQINSNRLETKMASLRFRISQLKNEIQRLSSKEENKDRNKLIHLLKEELDRILKFKIGWF